MAEVLRAAGWPESIIPLMVAVAQAESSLCVDAVNPGVNGSEYSIGLLQINMNPRLGRSYSVSRLASDPVYNAKVAFEIYRQQGLKAWGAFTDGRYKAFFRGAADAVSEIGDDLGAGFGSLGAGLGSFFGFDWLLAPVQPAAARFRPFVGQSPVTGQQRYLIAVAIAVIIIVFFVRDI